MTAGIARGQSVNQKPNPVSAHEEIRTTYPLTPGAHVTITNLPFGALVIQPVDTGVAELHVVRTAATAKELNCNRITISHTPTSLDIRGDDNSACTLQNTSIEQSIVLRLPRFVSIELNAISAPLIVGEAESRGPNFVTNSEGCKTAQPSDRPYVYGKGFDGSVTLKNISGPVRLVHGTGETKLSGVNGVVRVALRHADSKSVTLSGINGEVTLVWGAAFNGQIATYNIRGSVLSRGTTASPRVDSKGTYRINAGSEIALVSVSNVIGNVIVVHGDEEQ